MISDVSEHVVVDLVQKEDDSPQLPMEAYNFGDNLLRIRMPGEQVRVTQQSSVDMCVTSRVLQTLIVGITEKMSVSDVLEHACDKRQLVADDHFMRLKMPNSDCHKVPDKSALLSSEVCTSTFGLPLIMLSYMYMSHLKILQEFDAIEICPKILFQLELSRDACDVTDAGASDANGALGVSVEAELADDADAEDELRVFVADVTRNSVAQRAGLVVGDEILVINGRVVAELDMVYVEHVLNVDARVTMTVRSCRVARPSATNQLQEHADVYIDNMVCPPPPSQSRISDTTLETLVVPAPHWGELVISSFDEQFTVIITGSLLQ